MLEDGRILSHQRRYKDISLAQCLSWRIEVVPKGGLGAVSVRALSTDANALYSAEH